MQMTIRYPIAIEPGDAKHAYGVVVPDLPGCFSAGDTLDEAIANAPEAIALWLEDAVERGEVAPAAQPFETHRKNPELKDWIWAVVEVDLSRLTDKAERTSRSVFIWEYLQSLCPEGVKECSPGLAGAKRQAPGKRVPFLSTETSAASDLMLSIVPSAQRAGRIEPRAPRPKADALGKKGTHHCCGLKGCENPAR